eukprot:TRINITY_DN14922_c0_g1_i1.p1 TRINITY_DN14922_c0_g1~~TRINITY_DN14922_c0_g1_i1.p1  ORF type:complete len:163 (+),score=22.54 TRINITY_DN14922_c0_g1_i1:88-576(+)
MITDRVFITNNHVIPRKEDLTRYYVLFPTDDPTKQLKYLIDPKSPFWTSPKAERPTTDKLDYAAFKLVPEKSGIGRSRCPPKLQLTSDETCIRGKWIGTLGYPDGDPNIKHVQGITDYCTPHQRTVRDGNQKRLFGLTCFSMLKEKLLHFTALRAVVSVYNQ